VEAMEEATAEVEGLLADLIKEEEDKVDDLLVDQADREADLETKVQEADLVDLTAVDAPADIVDLKVQEAPGVSKAQEVLQDGEVLATVTATDVAVQEVHPDGTTTDGHMATDLGDLLDGTDLDTTKVTVPTSAQAGDQVGSLFQTMPASQSRFLSQMAAGAILPADQTFILAQMCTMDPTSFTIQAATIPADTTISKTFGTTTRPASTTSTTPRVAPVLTANTMNSVSGSTMTRAHSMTTTSTTTLTTMICWSKLPQIQPQRRHKSPTLKFTEAMANIFNSTSSFCSSNGNDIGLVMNERKIDGMESLIS